MGSGDFSLTGKRILVTGGGAGIGAAICRAASTAGAAVAVNDLDADRAAEIASRVGGFGVPGDVASEAGAAGVVEAAAAVLGGLDGLVNNAGIVTMGNLAGADLDEWRKVMDVNFQSVYLCSRAGRRRRQHRQPGLDCRGPPEQRHRRVHGLQGSRSCADEAGRPRVGPGTGYG